MFAAFSALILAATPFEPVLETDRVHEHLAGALRLLRAVPPDGFSAEVWERRQQSIARLEQYTEARRYPRNLHVDRLTPIFVDEFGTRCAMAYLIEQSGGAAFVEKVRSERNLAFVRELVDEPALQKWLAENGFSVAEAARVQPSYSFCAPRRLDCICWLGGPAALVSIDSVASETRGTIEMAWGPPVAGATVGSSFTVNAPVLRMRVGQTIVVHLAGDPSLPTPWWPFEQGRVSCLREATCADQPSMPLDEAIARASSPCCRAELAADPVWGEVACVGLEPFECAPDGGRWPLPLSGEVHLPDLTCDGGVGRDGGVTSGARDAGAQQDLAARSCSVAGAWLLTALTALLLRRARRRAFVTGS